MIDVINFFFNQSFVILSFIASSSLLCAFWFGTWILKKIVNWFKSLF